VVLFSPITLQLIIPFFVSFNASTMSVNSEMPLQRLSSNSAATTPLVNHAPNGVQQNGSSRNAAQNCMVHSYTQLLPMIHSPPPFSAPLLHPNGNAAASQQSGAGGGKHADYASIK
jgi:hypothetical protein